MKTIKTEVTISAKPERIWATLTDFENFSEWNPFIISISGEKKAGGQLDVRIKPPDGNPMRFKPIILTFEENKELRWKGKLLIRGLFDGEHYFILKENKDGTTTFTQGENFSGLLIGLFGKTLDKTEQGFILMNEAIKARCES